MPGARRMLLEEARLPREQLASGFPVCWWYRASTSLTIKRGRPGWVTGRWPANGPDLVSETLAQTVPPGIQQKQFADALCRLTGNRGASSWRRAADSSSVGRGFESHPPHFSMALTCGNVHFVLSDRQLCLNGLNPLLVGLESGGARGSSNPSDLWLSR